MLDRIVIADVGAGFGRDPRWDSLDVHVLAFDPLDAPQTTTNVTSLPVALGARRETRTLLLTRFGAASGLYSAERLFSRFDAAGDVEVVGTRQIDVVDFDSVAEEHGLPSPDFFKIDVQGAELEVLRGASAHLARLETLGVAVEVWFEPPGEGIPTFGEIDAFLRPLGYHLFDLTVQRYARRGHAPPLYDLDGGYGQTATGQAIWGDAVYFRDPVGDDSMLEPRSLAALARLMDAYGLSDCAAELATHAAR
jgi:FkbM family methyltransferase